MTLTHLRSRTASRMLFPPRRGLSPIPPPSCPVNRKVRNEMLIIAISLMVLFVVSVVFILAQRYVNHRVYENHCVPFGHACRQISSEPLRFECIGCHRKFSSFEFVELQLSNQIQGPIFGMKINTRYNPPTCMKINVELLEANNE